MLLLLDFCDFFFLRHLDDILISLSVHVANCCCSCASTLLELHLLKWPNKGENSVFSAHCTTHWPPVFLFLDFCDFFFLRHLDDILISLSVHVANCCCSCASTLLELHLLKWPNKGENSVFSAHCTTHGLLCFCFLTFVTFFCLVPASTHTAHVRALSTCLVDLLRNLLWVSTYVSFLFVQEIQSAWLRGSEASSNKRDVARQ